MCIIAAKPAGAKMPEQKYINNMFANNKDGAGFMYAHDGKVYIEKGFMNQEAFEERLEELSKVYDMDKLPMVMHFRITTHGGTKPENCHPFPVSDSIGHLKKLRTRTDLGVAHNGIITIDCRNKDISDTMEYVASQMAPLKRTVPKFYKNKDLLEMISNAIGSKMVILNGKGEMVFIGNFEETDGVKYSNGTYKYGSSLRDFYYSYDFFEDDFDDCGTYIQRKLMWLDESKGEYVKTKSGEMLQDNFAIDKNGGVYYFEYNYGAFVKLYHATAHNAEGGILRFDPDSIDTIEELVVI